MLGVDRNTMKHAFYGVDRNTMKYAFYGVDRNIHSTVLTAFFGDAITRLSGFKVANMSNPNSKRKQSEVLLPESLGNNFGLSTNYFFLKLGFIVDDASVRSESSKKVRKVLLHTKWVRINSRLFYEVATLLNPTSPRLLLA